ncbi:MAG: ABC transporter permease [Chloroflexi bacterium]|nr:ABC transporter permease [Chloroflexota bacterium]
MDPRWRKVVRDLFNNKLRTMLVVISIAVGVFAVGMISGTQSIIGHDLPADYVAINPPSAIVITGGFDDDFIPAVRRMPEIAQAEGRRTANLRIKVGPAGERKAGGNDEWRTIRMQAVQDFNKIEVNVFQSESGAWPPPDRTILIERNTLPVLKVKDGDSLLVQTPDNKLYELRISGIVHDLNEPPAVFTGLAFGYVTRDTLEWLGLPRDFNVIDIVVADNRLNKPHIQDVVELIKTKLQEGGYRYTGIYLPEPGEHPAQVIINSMLMILGVIGALSLFLSGFLVVNTIMAILAQQIRQIGIMKAVGALTPQIIGMYMTSVLIYGGLSLFVAVPLGSIAAYYFSAFIANIVNFNTSPFRIPPETLAIEVAVGLLVPLAAAIAPIFTGARISVREALSNYGAPRTKQGGTWTDRLVEHMSLLSRPLILSLRNTFRRKGRLVLTLFTLTLGGAIFIAVLSVQTSLFATLDEALAYWRYDVALSFSNPHRIDLLQSEAMRVPGVTGSEAWAGASVKRLRSDGHESPALNIVAPPANSSLIRPVMLEGRWLTANDENAIVVNTEVIKQEEDLAVGKPVTLKFGDRETTWTVVGIAKAVMTGPLMYANAGYLARETRTVGRSTALQVTLNAHDAEAQRAGAAALKEHLDNVGLRVVSTQQTSQTRSTIEYQFNIIVVFMTIMALLLAVVGGLGLMGTMSINVLERQREIGVMRAIGASDGSVLLIFMSEGVLIGGISWILSVIFAIPISRLMSDAVGIAFLRSPLSYTFAMNGALIWLGTVLALAGLASLLPSWRAMRLTVREVLAYE